MGEGQRRSGTMHAVISKRKATNILFLVGSFLMCWPACPFCRNLLLSTNDLEDGGRTSKNCKWGILFGGQGIFFGGHWLLWNGMNNLIYVIFVINEDLSIFNISHHANIRANKSRVSVCLRQEILIHRFMCCICFGLFFCKHMPSVLFSRYVVCGTIPPTWL